jgi:tRNA(fMet)-specific endonuclease VapC
MAQALLDTDTLSEVIKGRDALVAQRAQKYLQTHKRFTFSIVTRYEILRGLKAKGALQQIAVFEDRCRESQVLPLIDTVVVQAAEIYAELHRRGRLISDADILIAAAALTHDLALVTENTGHFERITGLRLESWRTPSK